MTQLLKRNSRSDQFINVLIGASDGLMIPPALLAGFATAGSARQEQVTTGSILIASISILMAVGGYLTRRNAELQPRNAIQEELRTLKPDSDRRETKLFFANLGLSESMQEKALSEMDKDELEWKQFIDRYELDPPSMSAAVAGLVIGLSYATAGFISMLPYILIDESQLASYWSVGICIPLLFLLGFTKGRLTSEPALGAALRLAGTGLLTVAAAYTVVQLFMK